MLSSQVVSALIARLSELTISSQQLSAIDTIIACRDIRSSIELIEKSRDIQEAAMAEFNANSEANVLFKSGFKICLKKAGTKYDYTQCNDTVLLELVQAQERINKEIKARQDFLRLLPQEGVEVADEESGEVIHLFPPKIITQKEIIEFKKNEKPK